MITIAITGIGGFIGRRMAERAQALGWSVRGLDLAEAALAPLLAQGVDARQGDVTDAQALDALFAGVDLVFHAAAVVAEDGPAALYERVNNQGTRAVCEAARRAGVRRLIHLSSIMVYGFDYPSEVTEDGPFNVAGNLYNETKLSSERIALQYNVPERGLGVIVIRPGDVYGAGSVPWVLRPLQMMQRHQFVLPMMGRGLINHVHVDNLIDGILLAHAQDRCGEVFNITDDQATSCREFFAFHLRMLGRSWVPVLPSALVLALVGLMDVVLPRLGQPSPARPAAIRFLMRRHKVSCARAREVLGYAPAISLQQGMRVLERELRAAHRIQGPN